jgi:hypothetical protein
LSAASFGKTTLDSDTDPDDDPEKIALPKQEDAAHPTFDTPGIRKDARQSYPPGTGSVSESRVANID